MSDIELKLCENCENHIPIANYGLHVVTCRRHTYRCERCGECVAVSGREEHEQLRHTQEQCSLCGDSFLKADTAAHLLECEYANELCEFCDSEVRRREMAEHRDACGSRTERCHTCSRYVLLRHKDTHTCEVASTLPQHDFSQGIGTAQQRTAPYERFRDYSPEFTRANFEYSHTPRDISPPFIPTQYVDLSEDTEPTAGPPDTIESSDSAPCEFCGNQVPLLALEGHQERCRFRGADIYEPKRICPKCKHGFSESTFAAHFMLCRDSLDKFDRPIGPHQTTPEPEPTPEDSSSLIPCEFCDQSFGMDEISTHQLACQMTTHIPVDTMHERATRCEFCGVFFTITEIGPHRNKCTFRKPALSSKFRTNKRETKCKYCFEVFELEEVEDHQNRCPRRRTASEDKICQYCFKLFSNDTISTHENTCSERQLSEFIDSSLELPFQDKSRGFEEKPKIRMGKCQFCFMQKPVEELLEHKRTCSMNPEYLNLKPLRSSREQKSTQFEAKLLSKQAHDSINRTSKLEVKSKCKYCLENFPKSSVFQHEKVCNLRNYSTEIDEDLNLPFHEHFPALDEKPKPISVDNKCPFCKFPQPAMELDKHKAKCSKNPKFRGNAKYFENQTEIGSGNSGPELLMSSRPIPVPLPRYQDREKNVPSSNYNPFLQGSGLTGTEQKMDLGRSRLQNQKKDSEKFPSSRKQNPQTDVTNSSPFGASGQSFTPTTRHIPGQEPVSRKHQSPKPKTEPFNFYGSSKSQNPKSEIHTYGASDQSFKPTTGHIPRQEPVSRKQQSPKPKTEPFNLYGTSKDQNPKSETVYRKSHTSTSPKGESYFQRSDSSNKPKNPDTYSDRKAEKFSSKTTPPQYDNLYDKYQASKGVSTISDVTQEKYSGLTKSPEYKIYSEKNSSPANSPLSEGNSPDPQGFSSPTQLFRDKDETKPAFSQKTVPPKSRDFHMELKMGDISNTSATRGTFNRPPTTSGYSPSGTSTSGQKTRFQINPELTSPSSRVAPTYPEHSIGLDSLSGRRGSDTKHPRTELGYQKYPDRVVYRPPSDTDDYPHTVSNGTETIVGMHSTPPKKSPGISTDKYLPTKTSKGSQTHY